MRRPETPAEAIALTCTDLRQLSLSLDILCPCGRSITAPFRHMLIERSHLALVALGRIVPRIRCERCGRPPVHVSIVSLAEAAAEAAAINGPRCWRVVLLG